MKTSLVILTLLLTMTIGGCTRNVNQYRDNDDRRARRGVNRDRDHNRDRNDQDHRPSN